MTNKLIVLIIFTVCGQAHAQFSDQSYLAKRAAVREGKRWTLQEWLEQRDRNRMMDLWLALHSPSPFELMLGAAYKSQTVETNSPKMENSYVSSDGYVTAHAALIGITAEYENNVQERYNDVSGMLNLRVFGDSIQSSYLALHYGQRTRSLTSYTPSSDYKNQFAQASLQLYLMRYFGIDGSYRHYIPNSETALNQEIRGSLAQAGVFIDFKALRIFGAWYQDIEIKKSTLTPFDETSTNRIGSKAGIKLYF